MESPFYPNNNDEQSIVTVYLEPILDSYSKKYINVITFSSIPAGPLKEMVKILSLPKLSPFIDITSNIKNDIGYGCTYILLKYPKYGVGSIVKDTNNYMMADDIPAFFSYLTNHEYVIKTDLTKMMNHSQAQISGPSDKRFSGNRKMICIIQYSPI